MAQSFTNTEPHAAGIRMRSWQSPWRAPWGPQQGEFPSRGRGREDQKRNPFAKNNLILDSMGPPTLQPPPPSRTVPIPSFVRSCCPPAPCQIPWPGICIKGPAAELVPPYTSTLTAPPGLPDESSRTVAIYCNHFGSRRDGGSLPPHWYIADLRRSQHDPTSGPTTRVNCPIPGFHNES